MARLIRLREVTADIGLSKWTLARLEAVGEFPQRIRIGRYAIGYDADEVEAWKQRRKELRGKRERRNAVAEHRPEA